MPRPPSTYDGRTTTGNPIWPATSRASAREIAVPLDGCGMPRSHSSLENRWRSSARSIESGEVPRISTPASCSGSASFSGVCPPNCTRHDTDAPALCSFVITAITSSNVSGSKYRRSVVS